MMGVGIFLREMNKMARKIGMYNSNFANPHGLSNTASFSTASDVAKLCSYSMRNKHFRKVVATRNHAFTYICPYNTI